MVSDLYNITNNIAMAELSNDLLTAPHTWNSLPFVVRSCRTVDTFKRHLKAHWLKGNVTAGVPALVTQAKRDCRCTPRLWLKGLTCCHQRLCIFGLYGAIQMLLLLLLLLSLLATNSRSTCLSSLTHWFSFDELNRPVFLPALRPASFSSAVVEGLASSSVICLDRDARCSLTTVSFCLFVVREDLFAGLTTTLSSSPSSSLSTYRFLSAVNHMLLLWHFQTKWLNTISISHTTWHQHFKLCEILHSFGRTLNLLKNAP